MFGLLLGCWLGSPCSILGHLSLMSASGSFFCLPISVHPRRQQVLANITWNTWIEFLAQALASAQRWPS